jgi:CHAT domain-containing protein
MRHRVRIAIGLIVAGGAASVLLRGIAIDFLIRIELARAIETANRAHPLDPQLADDHDFARAIAVLLPVPRPAQRAGLMRLASGRHSDATLHAKGVALLLANRPMLAIESLSAIPPARRTASVWTNLAAAESRAAGPSRDHDHLLSALVAVDEALALSPASVEAKLDRDLILHSIGLLVGHEDDEASWKRQTAHIDRLSDQELTNLTRSYPQQARRYAEGSYLCEWADAVNRGGVAESDAMLHRIDIFANALRSRGEGFLFDVVSSIHVARANNDVARLRATAVALDLYRRGRLATKDHAATSAAASLVQARDAFAEARSPMAALADCYVAINLIDSNRGAEAKRLLGILIAAQRAAGTHPALLALALYHAALIDARSGNWSNSLTAANESVEIFRRIGERGLVGTVEGLLSQDYEFLGQPQLAWQHGIAGIELSLRAGDPARARATLAALSRAELRNGRWNFARSLIRAEPPIASRVEDAPQACDMLIRIATADDHMGHAKAAKAAMTAARRRAQQLPDPALRAKLLADVDAAAGSLMRAEPDRALPLLTSAISFQEKAGRAIVLPALFLERGRAELALHRDMDASRDFEAGIAALEQQRSRTLAAELRPGIFDNAAELFDEAVSLALRQGMPAAAFAYVERSRARAVLEEIASMDSRGSLLASSGFAIGDVMRALGPDDLLLEYERLGDRLVVFVIDRKLCTFTMVGQTRSMAQGDAESLIAALDGRRPLGEIEQLSSRVYAALIGQIRERVVSKRNLIIVGDASLQQLPFAALYDPAAGRFLIEDHPIVIAPSAAVYVLSSHRHLAARTTPPTAAVFANPMPHAAPFESLEPLPASESEARMVARGYASVFLALRSAATASRFAALAPRFDVVHFAGHTVQRPVESWRSALLFASSGSDDGTLSVEQVTHMSFSRTRIVILAACSTLRAQKSGVEGVPSIARAFLVAGVPSVVGTLSDVDDFEAATLLSLLHTGIRKGLAPADALRAAQLAVLRGDDPALRHPGYWAAFALLGSGVR